MASFDISYEEFKELCKEAWEEKYSYLQNNRFD